MGLALSPEVWLEFELIKGGYAILEVWGRPKGPEISQLFIPEHQGLYYVKEKDK